MGGRQEDSGSGSTWWLLSALQGSHLRPPEIPLGGQEPWSPELVPELVPLLNSAYLFWAFIVIIVLILIIVISQQ